MDIRFGEYLQKNILLADGSFGTFYAERYGTNEMPELANTDSVKQRRVYDIHRLYIEAGAGLIRTNTFAANTQLTERDMSYVRENIRAAVKIAREAAEGKNGVYIAGDIGPVSTVVQGKAGLSVEQAAEQYVQIADTFIDEGVDILCFETFPETDALFMAIEHIKNGSAAGKELFIMCSFSVNQFGYSGSGFSAARLLKAAHDNRYIDVFGLNCGVGPGHMQRQIESCRDIIADARANGRFFAALPNAGYPERIRGQIKFVKNASYFSEKLMEIVGEGDIDIIGGCCGTDPDFIKMLSSEMKSNNINPKSAPEISEGDENAGRIGVRCNITSKKESPGDDMLRDGEAIRTDCALNAFFAQKKPRLRQKLIAVELAPPVNSDDTRLLEAAKLLKQMDVDVITFPDSPSGRTRVDSVLMAQKVYNQTKMCVMPHICCRDKNTIAMRSLFLGGHINGINNYLIVTGDPVPSLERGNVKGVFNFDSVGLMELAKEMNAEFFPQSPICYGGAINQGRHNIEVELARVSKKLKAGAQFFLTQPVFTGGDADRLRYIKDKTGARILCGIMPLVSRKNALFMKNEIAGVAVTDEIVERYPADASRQQGERIGTALAKEIMELTADFADGYYFSFPFNRVHMLGDILE